MKAIVQSAAAAALALAGSAALADDHELTFDSVDANGDGKIVLSEVQAVAPRVTEEQFASFDEDDDDALNETEFEAWKEAWNEMGGDDPM
jgi:hypothetical protein